MQCQDLDIGALYNDLKLCTFRVPVLIEMSTHLLTKTSRVRFVKRRRPFRLCTAIIRRMIAPVSLEKS